MDKSPKSPKSPKQMLKRRQTVAAVNLQNSQPTNSPERRNTMHPKS